MKRIKELFYDDYFDRLNNMVRWNGTKRIKDETVGHHSFIVSWFSRILLEAIFVDDAPKLIGTTYAIFHDFDENVTGDVLSPLKYNPMNGEEIRKLLNKYVEIEIDNRFPETGDNIDIFLNKIILGKEVPLYIKKIVKIADWMSMQFYLKKESELGNLSVSETMARLEKEIEYAIYTAKVELISQKDYTVNLEIFNE
jgi:5'-deoxynucleotidase YfbR-like HD superfamily hydrolase